MTADHREPLVHHELCFACGQQMRATSLELSIEGPVPVGAFIELEAQALGSPGPGCRASASATTGGRRIATAKGLYEPT